MTKYKVVIFRVEVPKEKGLKPQDVWDSETNHNITTVRSFDTPEEAKVFYDTIITLVKDCGRYNLHFCKAIEINDYDDNGDLVNGGDWQCVDFGENL